MALCTSPRTSTALKCAILRPNPPNSRQASTSGHLKHRHYKPALLNTISWNTICLAPSSGRNQTHPQADQHKFCIPQSPLFRILHPRPQLCPPIGDHQPQGTLRLGTSSETYQTLQLVMSETCPIYQQINTRFPGPYPQGLHSQLPLMRDEQPPWKARLWQQTRQGPLTPIKLPTVVSPQQHKDCQQSPHRWHPQNIVLGIRVARTYKIIAIQAYLRNKINIK